MQDIELQTVAHPLTKYRKHLEFNEYQVQEENEKYLRFCHPSKDELWVSHIGDRGVSIRALYGTKQHVKRTGLLEFINTLNAESLLMKAYLSDEGLLQLETFFEGTYDRTNFSILLENIDFDIQAFWQRDLTQVYIE